MISGIVPSTGTINRIGLIHIRSIRRICFHPFRLYVCLIVYVTCLMRQCCLVSGCNIIRLNFHTGTVLIIVIQCVGQHTVIHIAFCRVCNIKRQTDVHIILFFGITICLDVCLIIDFNRIIFSGILKLRKVKNLHILSGIRIQTDIFSGSLIYFLPGRVLDYKADFFFQVFIGCIRSGFGQVREISNLIQTDITSRCDISHLFCTVPVTALSVFVATGRTLQAQIIKF